MSTTPATTVTRLIGVYDADGTLWGELSYWVGARLGRTHCSLCEITHGLVKKRGAWVECSAAMPVPFETFHRDDQPDAVRAARGAVAPVVVAELDNGTFRVLLGPDALELCEGSVDRFSDALHAALAEHGLEFSNE